MRKPSILRFFPISLLCIAITLPLLAHPHDRLEWAISDGERQTMVATNRDGHRAIRRLERELDVPFIWVRQDDNEFVITDPATVEKARAIFDSLPELEKLEVDLQIDLENFEEIVEKDLEKDMERFERRMAEIEKRIENGSFAAIGEIAEAAAELDFERIDEISRIAQEKARHIELKADDIEAWAHNLEKRIDDEAIPLLENAIRTGIAKPIRR